MLWYIVTALLGIALWKTVQILLLLRRHMAVIETVKLHGEFPSYFSLDFFKRVKDSDSFFRVVQPWVMKNRVSHYSLWIIGILRPVYFFVKPREVKAVMQLPASEPKGPAYSFLFPWLGDGLLTSSGKKWERNRRLLTPAFHFDILRPYVGVYNRVVDKFLGNIKTASAAGGSMDIYPLISAATLDTMLRCALSYEDDIQQLSSQHPYLKAVLEVSDLISVRSINPWLYRPFVYNLTANGKKFKRLCDFVHDFADKIIAARRQTLKADPSSLKKRHPDFLDILLGSKDEDGKGLSDLEIREEVDTFMFEGHDTTASAISWALHSLAKYPDEQEKVLEEVNRVLGDRSEPEWKDLPQLTYLTYFLKESMRLNTVVPSATRISTKPTKIGDIVIPEDSELQFQIYLMNRHPDLWDEPEVFRPKRFLYENMKEADPFQFVPFSAGTRNCIGQNFAMNEMKVFVARTVKRFRIELDPKRESVHFYSLVLRSKDGIHLRFLERS